MRGGDSMAEEAARATLLAGTGGGARVESPGVTAMISTSAVLVYLERRRYGFG